MSWLTEVGDFLKTEIKTIVHDEIAWAISEITKVVTDAAPKVVEGVTADPPIPAHLQDKL